MAIGGVIFLVPNSGVQEALLFGTITLFSSLFVQLGRQVSKHQSHELLKLHKDATVYLGTEGGYLVSAPQSLTDRAVSNAG